MSEYLRCPKCHNEDFGGTIFMGELQTDSGVIWRECECNCGFEWQEVYVFSHNETPDATYELDDEGNKIEKLIIDSQIKKLISDCEYREGLIIQLRLDSGENWGEFTAYNEYVDDVKYFSFGSREILENLLSTMNLWESGLDNG